MHYISSEEVGCAAFLGLAIALLAAFFSDSTAYRGTPMWKHSFNSLLVVAAVVIQFCYVCQAALKVPSNAVDFVQQSCIQSTKGGKLAGSYKNCLSGQPDKCTKENPCIPCDYMTAMTPFDGKLWPNNCRPCGLGDPGVCHEPGNEADIQWCSAKGGTVEPCHRCCADFGKHANGSQITSRELFYQDNCDYVFNPERFAWNTSENLACTDEAFPVITRFGCCSKSAARDVSGPLKTLGTGEVLPSCAFTGPSLGGWHQCKEEEVKEVDGVLIPQGCKSFINGKSISSPYCIPPTIVE